MEQKTAEQILNERMNAIAKRAAATQMAWTLMLADMSGYQPKTTFYQDFTIAELTEGVKGVQDTYKRAFKEWKDNVTYLTELVLVLNHKSWEMADRGENELGMLYQDLYLETNDWAYDHLKGEDLTYYWETLD